MALDREAMHSHSDSSNAFPPGPAGVLLLHKRPGMTSRDVVDLMEQKLTGLKAGHAGTLDRAAEGLLPVMWGHATRLIPYLQERPKSYRVSIRFDLRSETLDRDGEVYPVAPRGVPSHRSLMETLGQFTGRIKQVPPLYSAIRKNGQRLYELARKGEETEADPRDVVCHRIDVLAYSFPVLRLRVTCGKGFYVRSLVRDLARDLRQEGGIVSELLRVTYGPYRLRQAVRPDEPHNWNNGAFPPRTAVDHLHTVRCGPRRLKRIRHGTWVSRPTEEDHERAVAMDENGRVLAILEADERDGEPRWQPRKVFVQND